MNLRTRAASRPISRMGALGASLIEALVCLSIMGIITTGMYSFFVAVNQSYGDQAVVSRTLWTANDAMKHMAEDIRRAGTSFALAPCASFFPSVVSASNASGGSITISVVLEDPARRIELASNQLQTSATLRVLSTDGYQINDTAFLTDGVQCTRFVVTAIAGGTPPGLTHIPANDTNTGGAAGYTYSAATSMVYRQLLSQQFTYAIDTSDPMTPWLTRNTGAGAVRFVPDVEGISLSYQMADGSTVSDPSTVTTVSAAANIRRVSISVTAKADTRSLQVGGYRQQTLTSSVNLRNLGS